MKRAKVREIAEQKMPDLNAASVEAAMRMVEGTARSMGITSKINSAGMRRKRSYEFLRNIAARWEDISAKTTKEDKNAKHGKKYREAAKLVDLKLYMIHQKLSS